MKKLSFPISILICLTLFLTTIMPVFADTSIYIDEQANFLNKMNILSGSGGNYNLNSRLKKGEASAFIVKLLGAANEVETNKEQYSSTDFTDVDPNEWYTPYIGYCLSLGIITNSISGKYEPDQYITEMTFLSMTLRALRYEYSDFSWSTTYKFSYEKGLVIQALYETKSIDNTIYYRKDAVSVLFNALCAEKKTGGTLIQDMIASGKTTRDEAIKVGLIKDKVKTAVSAINSVNSNKITVKFNEVLVDLDKANLKVYETSDKTKILTINSISQSEEEIALQVSPQTPDKSYTFEITGAKDEFGNVSGILSATFKGYKIPEIISDYFKVSKVEPISKNVINLYFTQPINQNAEIPTYYEISDGITSIVQGIPQAMSVNLLANCNNGVSLFVKNFSFQDGTYYSLKVNGTLCSAYGNKLNDGYGDSMMFTGKSVDNTPFSIVSVTPLSSTRIAVEFSKEIDQNLGQKFLNYTVKDSDKKDMVVSMATIQTFGEKKNNSVILTLLNPLIKTKIYDLTIEYLPDAYRQNILEGYTASFSGLYPDNNDLNIVLAWSYEKAVLNICFDRSLDPQTAANPSHYYVRGVTDSSYMAIPEKVLYSETNGQPVVKLYMPTNKVFNSSSSYVVTVNTMKDSAGIVCSKNMEYTFVGGSDANSIPTISDAKIIAADAIKLKFSSEIAEDISNLRISNYSLEYKIDENTFTKIPTSVLYYDSLTVILRFDTLDPKTNYVLKLSQLKGFTGIIRSETDGKLSVNVIPGK